MTAVSSIRARRITSVFLPLAPASIFAYSPTQSGPLSSASGSTSAPSATQTPGESSKPAMSTSTLRLSTSTWALK